MKCRAILEGKLIDTFEIRIGVQHACLLPPTLFFINCKLGSNRFHQIWNSIDSGKAASWSRLCRWSCSLDSHEIRYEIKLNTIDGQSHQSGLKIHREKNLNNEKKSSIMIIQCLLVKLISKSRFVHIFKQQNIKKMEHIKIWKEESKEQEKFL